MLSFGPPSDVVDFKNMIGSDGSFAPDSFA
jgi:hypothetical protein